MKDQYFPHDYNAFNDLKITAFISQLGVGGYGIYWRIVELLHSQNNELELKKYALISIAKQMSTDDEFVLKCIEIAVDCELFDKKDNIISSKRVAENLRKRNEISEKRSKAGKISALKRTSVEQMLTSDEQNPTKKRKEKNIIEEYNKEKNTKKEKVGYDDFMKTMKTEIITKSNMVYPEWMNEELIELLSYFIFEFRKSVNKKLKNTGLAVKKIITQLENDSEKNNKVAIKNTEFSISKSYQMVYPEPKEQSITNASTGISPNRSFNSLDEIITSIQKEFEGKCKVGFVINHLNWRKQNNKLMGTWDNIYKYAVGLCNSQEYKLDDKERLKDNPSGRNKVAELLGNFGKIESNKTESKQDILRKQADFLLSQEGI